MNPNFKLRVPTFIGNTPAFISGRDEEFVTPDVPVSVYRSQGVRIVLGSHDYSNPDAPDIHVERRPGGWAIFLHPLGEGDPSGFVYFLDDGRSFVVPEIPGGPTPPIALCQSVAAIPELDDLHVK